jgi:archaellum biogenesis protein FlaJ (TadC family)
MPGVNFCIGPGLSICFAVIWIYLGIFVINFDLDSIIIISIIILGVVSFILYRDDAFFKIYKPKKIEHSTNKDKNNSANEFNVLLIIVVIITILIMALIKFNF